MRITTRRLGPLASELTGRRVRVELGHELPFHVCGVAMHDGCEYVVKLAPRLFEWGDAAGLAAAFWHECFHVLNGDVKTGGAPSGKASAADLAAGIRWATGAGATREDACDAFAEGMRRRVPDADLWALCVA